jgi:protein-disulfide isomerase
MSKGTAVFATLVALTIGCLIGLRLSRSSSSTAPPTNVAAPAADVERYRIPIDGAPARGGDRPRVTIVEFSDFECPYCSRVEPTLAALGKKYGRELRFVWKDFPLPQHRNAMPAAVAGRAASAQGKFWPMHDRMFADQRALDRDGLVKTGSALGIDLAKALDDPALVAAVRRDLDDARRFAVRGTPTLYVNGRPYRGPLTVEALSPLIDEERANAARALAAGADEHNLYAVLTKDARPSAQVTPPAQARVDVPIGKAPVRGRADAKVTVVEFSDFQCPACGRAEPMVQAMMKQLGDNVKLVWKNLPLEMHPFARQAAEAALAAGAQGHFWEMHDLLFANQSALDRASLDKYARELHLDMARFAKALDTHAYAADVAADEALAQKLNVQGTPTLFVDGVRVASWPTDLIPSAQAAVSRATAALRPRPGRPDPSATYRATVGDAPARGAKLPKVTIVEWADFECPYCARLGDALSGVAAQRGDDVRVVFKQFPLPNHPHGHLAAEASLAAKAQGKFWPMHDALFAHRNGLERAAIVGYARDAGLDVARFERELDAGTYKKAADAEAAEGARLGVQSTPSFFVDGKFHEGLLAPDALEAAVAGALTDADARLHKGVARKKLYDALMATAKAEVEQPPLVEPEAHAVDPGAAAPARGRADAPVTVVEFSDFECPFCKRAAALIADVQAKHADDVRVVFRFFPLPYHKHAQEAALAALAAKEQGRFWEMHDKLFANQNALDRPALDRYAAEIGLDVAKFDATLAKGGLADAISRDRLAGGSLVDGTPTLFVNGHKLTNPAMLAAAVDEALRARRKTAAR